ncbi:MAG: 60S ribosomal protein L22 [Candidatus Bathyarchaeia archaeon]
MAEFKIEVSELKREGAETIKGLVDFLREKTGADVEALTSEVTIKTDGDEISKRHLRVLLRKFLHKAELKDYFRVITGKENSLIIKERKILEEE